MVSERRTAATLALALVACGAAVGRGRFPLADPMARDDDMRLFAGPPSEYESTLGWDAADQEVFRQISQFFAVDPGGEAVDVNALDEVPDSSWFVNRPVLTPEELARGPCDLPPIDPAGPFEVVGAKPNGDNLGFKIAANGHRYLLKLEDKIQPERAASADVIGSRVYHAAGFYVPCNQIVIFERRALGSADKRVTEEAIDGVLAMTNRMPDGRYRAEASLFLPGKPLGAFRYQGTRDDDPNDVVPHQDRRELRGSLLLAAWLDHFDAREMNTLDTWIEVPGGQGFIRHNLLDWGDSLGSLWDWDELSRRIGYAHYFDVDAVLFDFFTLGIAERPWDRLRFGPTGKVLGYFEAEVFEVEEWQPGYPNPAFSRMTERDGAWMARTLARFSDAHIAALVELAQIANETVRRELQRVLVARRDKILRRYLGRLSALTAPRLAGSELCLDDVAVAAGIAARGQRRYAARAWLGGRLQPAVAPAVREDGAAAVCASLPSQPGASPAAPRYLIVDVDSFAPLLRRPVPARVHLYDLGGGAYRIVGLERPGDGAPPRP